MWYLHIVKLDDNRESVFLIQDMFPITEEYIERKYTIAGNHLMLTSEHTARTIEKKAKKVLAMVKKGVKFTPTQPNVMKILDKLKGWLESALDEADRVAKEDKRRYSHEEVFTHIIFEQRVHN